MDEYIHKIEPLVFFVIIKLEVDFTLQSKLGHMSGVIHEIFPERWGKNNGNTDMIFHIY